MPSIMWWEFSPSSWRMCRLMSAVFATAWKNSRASSVSNSPTFWLGMFAVYLRQGLPERSTAQRMSASSMGRMMWP